MTLIRTAVHALKWSVLAEIASRTVGTVVLLVLARLLVPEDFGVVAAATVVISISQVFADAGLEKALIQRQRDVERSASIVFWLNLVLGVIISSVLLLCAPVIARFFHDDRIGPVVRVLSLQVMLTGASVVHTGLLKRELNFRVLFWIRVLTTAAGAVGSIPLAAWGMGYWALVAGSIAGQAAQTVTLWMRSSWRPGWVTDRALIGELSRFGSWAALSGLLGWFYAWADAIVVGRYLGAHDLGLYRTGNTFVAMVFGLGFWPLLPVFYSMLSRAQDNIAAVRDAVRTVTHAITVVAFPLAAYLYVSSDSLAAVMFGTDWQGVGLVIAMMGLKDGLAWVVGANGEVYRAIGKPHVDTWASAGMLLIYLAGYLAAVRHGLVIFLETRIILAVVAIVAHLVVARVVIDVPIRSWLHWRPVAVAVISAVPTLLLRVNTESVLLDLTLRTLLFVLLATAATAALEGDLIRRVQRLYFATERSEERVSGA